MGKVLNKIDKIRPLRREGDRDQVEPRTMQMYCQFSLRTITFDVRSVYKRPDLSRRCKALKYAMHNRFSNFSCFASFLCSSSCSAHQFQLQCREQDLRQMESRIFRRHSSNRHLGRARIAEGVIKAKITPIVSNAEMIRM